MKNSKKQSNRKSKYDNDEDDISIRSLFSPDPLEEISFEQPTFSNYDKIEQNNFSQNNHSYQLVQRKALGFGVNLTPLSNFSTNRSFDYFSSNKSILQPKNSIFSLPTVNPNRKIIRLDNVKPIQMLTPQTKTLVVKQNHNRPDPLFTKIVYNKPQNNVLISLPQANQMDSNISSVSFTQPHDSISNLLLNSPNPQDSHKTKVIHHYHFYESPFKFLKKNGIIQNQANGAIKRKNIPVFNSTTQIQYMERNRKFLEKNNYETKFLIGKNSPNYSDSPNFESNDYFLYHKRNNFNKQK